MGNRKMDLVAAFTQHHHGDEAETSFFSTMPVVFATFVLEKISFRCYGLRDINDSFFAFIVCLLWETLM